MKIDRKRWKSSDDKKPAWNRAKVSVGAAAWALNSLSTHTPKSCKSFKSNENQCKFMKIDRKLWKSSDDKKPTWNRAKVSIGAAGRILSPLSTHTPKYMKIYQNLWKSMKIGRKRWKSSDDKKPAWNRAEVSIGAAGWPLSTFGIHTSKYMRIL